VPRRLVRGVVPRLPVGMPVERRIELPRLPLVAALEDAGHLGPGEQAAVRCGQPRHLGELQPRVLVVQALARLLPRLAEIGAPPDARAVPLACGGRVHHPAFRLVDGVVDRPALAVGAAQPPVAAAFVAFEQETTLPRADEQDGLRHSMSPPVKTCGSTLALLTLRTSETHRCDERSISKSTAWRTPHNHLLTR
jgi:hypothetical protein